MFLKKYKVINQVYDFNKIEDFFEGVTHCNLYRSDFNYFVKKDIEEECIASSEIFDILGQRIFVGNRSFDLSDSYVKDIKIYIGKDKNNLVLRMKRGYTPDTYTYYRIEKIK